MDNKLIFYIQDGFGMGSGWILLSSLPVP